MIAARAIAASMAGALPLPVVDDWLASRIRRGIIRRIAAARGVDIDDDAVAAIADGDAAPPSFAQIAGGTFLFKVLSRSWRKLMLAYVAADRARAAAKTFSVATLFDHYAARLHVGLGVDAATGRRLRRLMDECIDDTEGSIGAAVFRKAIAAAARASVRAPAELIDAVTGGRLRRLLSAGADEVVAVAEIDSAIERSMDEEAGFLARAARAVDAQLSAEDNPYLDDLVTCFESRWRQEVGHA
ncbi:MAG: hypothetical protein D6689_20910 [Deltaproteobacteria bacterium]|nr:MAG: hypothetical protein D6689_20910 [Deltaproteobacteria bacterium]